MELIVEEFKKLYKDTFEEKSDDYIDYFFTKKVGGGSLMYQKQDDELMTMMALIDKKILVNKERFINLPCITAIATSEKFRGQGKMEELFKMTFEELSKTEYPFVYINCTIPNYYKKYGFEPCFTYHSLSKKEKDDKITLFETENINYLTKVYNESFESYFMIRRDFDATKDRLEELSKLGAKAYLIRYQGKTKGYVIMSKKKVEEIAYNDSYSHLEHSIFADFDDLPLYSKYYNDTDKTGSIMKIVNAVEFFKLMKFNVEGEKTYKIRLKRVLLDPVCLEINVKDGDVTGVKEIDSADIDIYERDVIKIIRGLETTAPFLKDLKELDIFFVDKF